ncbi:hypothetical protein Tsubulata_014348 [Turnera subulata]|uniref:DUF4220 domain-containing protein n=1 Tax=Turnera subulata TaxID=218843 RepID=A0A9Q0F6C9_9ROSI|nr:hypothetical protein Tsubulata_014348 [Turnera subulata]
MISNLLKASKRMWGKWDTGVMVLASLSLQIILVTFGSRRKYMSSLWLTIVLWSASSPLTYLAIPIFVTGIIKYGERVWVLKLSSTKSIKDRLLSSLPRVRLDTKEIMVVPRGHYVPIITNSYRTNYLHQALYLFRMSIYLFGDFVLGYSELKDSHSIISCQSPKDAFKLVEVELGFIYDQHFTKAAVSFTRPGVFCRFVSSLSTLAALVTFTILLDHHNRKKSLDPQYHYSGTDITVAYILLGGAFFLELCAFFSLLFSDWTTIWLTKSAPGFFADSVFQLHTYLTRSDTSRLAFWIHGKRWSETVAQYSLIRNSTRFKIRSLPFTSKKKKRMKSVPSKCEYIMKFTGIDEKIRSMDVRRKPVSGEMKELIFAQLLEKGNRIIDDLHNEGLRQEITSARGQEALKKMRLAEEFKWCTTEVDFNRSLLIWHIATDLCFYKDSGNTGKEREVSKCLSDYLFYLFVLRPGMLPKGNGDTGIRFSRFRDASDEVSRFFNGRTFADERDACLEMFDMEHGRLEDTIATPIEYTPSVTGAYGTSKYMLVHGCMLARKLSLPEYSQRKWKIISEVWIEMLAYAASQSDWSVHTQQLRRGGELLTHVRLLMSHLGLSEQYKQIPVS